jgi:hypothetical protein
MHRKTKNKINSSRSCMMKPQTEQKKKAITELYVVLVLVNAISKPLTDACVRALNMMLRLVQMAAEEPWWWWAALLIMPLHRPSPPRDPIELSACGRLASLHHSSDSSLSAGGFISTTVASR